jgi:hypothetical protein
LTVEGPKGGGRKGVEKRELRRVLDCEYMKENLEF